MNFKKIPSFFLILVLFPALTQAISLSCDCSTETCHCISDCTLGLLDIYDNNCQGFPDYQLSLSEGKTKWLPPQEGQYYLRVLCDDNKKSRCELISVPSTIMKEGSKVVVFPYLFLLSLLLLTGLLIYTRYQKKKELRDIKKEVKK